MAEVENLDKDIKVEDIVHVICIEDIRNFVWKEIWEQTDGFVLATQRFTDYGKVRTKEIADNFIANGYEIFDVERYNKVVKGLKEKIYKLLKENDELEKKAKAYRHNVSKLQKKLNKEGK